MNIKALVVGLGQIGMGYDYHCSTDDFIATHARALYLHPNFELVGGVDSSLQRREMFSNKYSRPAYESLIAALEKHKPELVVIATPTTKHAEIFWQLIESSSLRLILFEKPIAMELEEAERMLETAKHTNIAIAVNYIRRYDLGIQKLLNRINSGELGFPLKVYVWYRKGIFNNGSHIINMISPLFGDMLNIKIISHGRLWDGWDPEPDLKLDFEKGEVYYFAGHEEDFSYTQVEIIGSKGKVVYDQKGEIYWWTTESDPSFPNYTILSHNAEKILTGMRRFQYNVFQNLSDFLSNNSKLHCDGEAGLQTMQVLNEIQEKLNE